MSRPIHYSPPHYVRNDPWCGAASALNTSTTLREVTCRNCLKRASQEGPTEALEAEVSELRREVDFLQNGRRAADEIARSVEQIVSDNRAVQAMRDDLARAATGLDALLKSANWFAEHLRRLQQDVDRLAARPLIDARSETRLERGAGEHVVPGQLAELRFHLHRLPGLLDAPECGIYFLVRGAHVVYVGQSVSLLSRVSQHRREKQFDGVLVLPVSGPMGSRPDQARLDAVEGAFIRYLRTPLNVSGTGPLTDADRAVLREFGVGLFGQAEGSGAAA